MLPEQNQISLSANWYEMRIFNIVSTVRQFWKLGAAVREPGARTRRVRAPRPLVR